jgi:hypothetical protein
MITQKELKELLQYNENTGIFTWLCDKGTNKVKNKIAGSIHSGGYLTIRINRKRYLAHRLAWLYIYGEWPKNQIDHINGIRDDNRIENLRNVTTRENQQNRKEHRNGKLVGCNFHKPAKKWRAHIQINGKQIYLGLYNTEQDAHEAYLKFLNNLTINN